MDKKNTWDLHFLGRVEKKKPLPRTPPRGALMAVNYADNVKRLIAIGGKWVPSSVPTERDDADTEN